MSNTASKNKQTRLMNHILCLEVKIIELEKDKARLDYLDSLAKGDGWLIDSYEYVAGYHLHTNATDKEPIRQAIDKHMVEK